MELTKSFLSWSLALASMSITTALLTDEKPPSARSTANCKITKLSSFVMFADKGHIVKTYKTDGQPRI